MTIRKWAGILAAASVFVPGVASATDGYFTHGYGMKAQGRGGTSIAIAEDAMGGANNPATMVFAGDRLDLGLNVFSPYRSASRTGNAFGLNGAVDSNSHYFFIPELGYNRMLSPNLSLGVTVYGNGGMNTDYAGGQIPAGRCGTGAPASNLLCGQGQLGVDLSQLIIAPTVAYKITPSNAIGLSPLFGYQRFQAKGLQAFASSSVSSSPANVTNNGYDDATGWGVRVGWMSKINDFVSVGAAYSSKVYMSKFHKYRGLFAEGGSFDIPENFGAGIAVHPIPDLLVAVDYQRINYSGVKAVSNPSNDPGLLGTDAGKGFGWQDVNVVKLGIEYKVAPTWTVRAGYNHTDNPIQSRDVTFNILAPGVIENHYTLGLTHAFTPGVELTLAYMHAQENSVSGATNALLSGGGTDTIKMSQNSFGAALGFKF